MYIISWPTCNVPPKPFFPLQDWGRKVIMGLGNGDAIQRLYLTWFVIVSTQIVPFSFFKDDLMIISTRDKKKTTSYFLRKKTPNSCPAHNRVKISRTQVSSMYSWKIFWVFIGKVAKKVLFLMAVPLKPYPPPILNGSRNFHWL